MKILSTYLVIVILYAHSSVIVILAEVA